MRFTHNVSFQIVKKAPIIHVTVTSNKIKTVFFLFDFTTSIFYVCIEIYIWPFKIRILLGFTFGEFISKENVKPEQESEKVNQMYGEIERNKDDSILNETRVKLLLSYKKVVFLWLFFSS